jgi:hypothetical protein
VRVKVSPGDKPISEFVSDYSRVVWDFDGDVGRIRRVFAIASQF